MKLIIAKLTGLPVLFIFINLGFLLFAREIFTQVQALLPVILFNVFIGIDIVIRPLSTRRDEYNRVIVALSFLAMPIIVFLPYYENKAFLAPILPTPVFLWLMVLGSGCLTAGGVILLLSRIQIGKFGGPKITIEEDHQLITTGMYRYIRHPLYLGFLLLFSGYSLALGSIIITIVIDLGLFLIFRSRMILEEELLVSVFGEVYSIYTQRTSRLIPFVY